MIITKHKQCDRRAMAAFKKLKGQARTIWLLTARLGVNMMSTYNRRTRTIRDWWMPRIGGINFTGKHRTPAAAYRAGERMRRSWLRDLRVA